MYSFNLRQWKKFDEVWCCVCKNVVNSEIFAKDFIQIDIMDLCLLPCSWFCFKRRLESVVKVFISEVVLTNLKMSEPIDAN